MANGDLSTNLKKLSETRQANKERRERTRALLTDFVDYRVKKEPPIPVGGTPVAGGAVARRLASGSGTPNGGDEATELWNRIQKMAKDAPGKLTPGKRTRDYATQVRLYNAYKAGKGPLAARPGSGKHPSGQANDLQYGNDDVREWALANAKNYGLAFPLYNPKLGRGRDEGWHVELSR